jgi:hypothetical protein
LQQRRSDFGDVIGDLSPKSTAANVSMPDVSLGKSSAHSTNRPVTKINDQKPGLRIQIRAVAGFWAVMKIGLQPVIIAPAVTLELFPTFISEAGGSRGLLHIRNRNAPAVVMPIVPRFSRGRSDWVVYDWGRRCQCGALRFER